MHDGLKHAVPSIKPLLNANLTWEVGLGAGALCALAAMSSRASMYCAIPGGACFQCHGVSACVTDPPQATLPLFIHYYGNKDTIHELDLIRAMPFLRQSLFGHEDTPPFWCQREWRAAADFAITCNRRQSPCWQSLEWQAVPPLNDTEAIGPHEVLALPSNISDGVASPASSAMPMAAPIGAEVELQDTAVPIGTEVLHVYSTGLNGSLPRDMPAEQSAATFHLRGAYGPSLSQMYADQGSQPASEAYLPRAPLRSHAEDLEFCRCLLDEDGHRCWREMLDAFGITDPEAWVRYAAKYATLPPLPAQLALLLLGPWSPLRCCCTYNLRCLQRLLTECIGPLSPTSRQRSRCTLQVSVQAHTRPLLLKLTTDSCVGTSNSPSAQAQLQWEPLAAQCSTWLRSFPPPSNPTQPACSLLSGHCVYHMSGKTLSVFGGLRLMSSSPCLHPFGRKTPVRLCSSQVLDSGDTEWLKWLGRENHNYAHLLRVTIPRNPAFLAVKATLKDLAAYSADFVPPEALDTLASYLLSWAATIAPFQMLTAEQLLLAASSDDGALQAARALSLKQRGGDLTFATARHVLVQNLCRAITRAVKQAKEGPLISSIVQRFLLDLPLRLLVLLLGRLLPLLRSTATTGAPLLEASGKTSGKRAHHAHHGQGQSP